MDFFYRIMFENKLLTLSGAAFEDFFCDTMKLLSYNFQAVKPYGNIGDMKCDGYNQETGDYYLVYSPDDIQKESTQKNAISKIKKDINGIVTKWSDIKRINYVINTKKDKLPPPVCQVFIELQKDSILPEIKIFSMQEFQDIFMKLSEDKRQQLIGYVPTLNKLEMAFPVLSETIKYLEKNYSSPFTNGTLVIPDFTNKIAFNKLSSKVAEFLNTARYSISKIDDFFNVTSDFSKVNLQNILIKIYQEACNKISDQEDDYSDKRFFYVFDNIRYNKECKSVADCALIIMATFFETCDIFEEPIEEE